MRSSSLEKRARIALPAHVAAALWILAILAIVVILRGGRSLLIPLALSGLLTYALSPLVGWLQRIHVPRLLAVGLVMISLAGTTVVAGIALQSQAAAVIENLPDAVRRIRTQLETSGIAGLTLDKLREAKAEIDRASQGSGAAVRPAPASTPQLGGLLWWGSAGIAAIAGHAAVIFFLIFFMLLSGDLFRRKLQKLTDSLPRWRVTADALDEIDREIRQYLLARVLTSVIVGVATWAALAWLGMQYASIWAIGAAICNWIPYLGPLLISGGLLIVGLFEFGSLSRALAASGSALVITALEGWLIDPPLMGKIQRMNTVAVLVGLMFWTFVWGAWGTLLAVPMLAVTKTICDRTDGLKPIGELIGQ